MLGVVAKVVAVADLVKAAVVESCLERFGIVVVVVLVVAVVVVVVAVALACVVMCRGDGGGRYYINI